MSVNFETRSDIYTLEKKKLEKKALLRRYEFSINFFWKMLISSGEKDKISINACKNIEYS